MRKSNLIPLRDEQLLDYETWDQHTSYEHKWEFWQGIPFGPDGIERDRLAVCLVYNMGLAHFVNLLPQKSKDVLREVLKEGDKINKEKPITAEERKKEAARRNYHLEKLKNLPPLTKEQAEEWERIGCREYDWPLSREQIVFMLECVSKCMIMDSIAGNEEDMQKTENLIKQIKAENLFDPGDKIWETIRELEYDVKIKRASSEEEKEKLIEERIRGDKNTDK